MPHSSPSLDVLPDALLERILALLPFTNVFRIAAVCKRWNSIVSAKAFVHLCEQRTSSRPWFFLYKPGIYEGFAYDPLDERWLNCGKLLSGLERPCWLPVASANGLICFNWTRNSNDLIVCNPMTKFVKKLAEPSPKFAFHIYTVSMAANKDSASPTIILAQFNDVLSQDFIVNILEYDFSLQKWGTKAVTRVNPYGRGKALSVICKGFFYCIVMPPAERHYLITYELSSGVLNVAPMGPAPFSLKFMKLQLLNCNDKVVIVGQDVNRQKFAAGIGIWELVDTEWQEIARMPVVHSKTLDNYFCSSGLGDFIYFHASRARHLFLYSVTERSWVRTERYPMAEPSLFHAVTYAGICFEPRLKVSALEDGPQV